MLRLSTGLFCVAIASTAYANGRAPGTSTIHFRQGHEQDVAAGMTFGLLLSHDSGATWQWMCETAVGYGGLWDPQYAYASTGSLFATTFDGFKAMRDGCTFVSTPRGNTFVTADALAGDGRIAAAASDSGGSDVAIYTSTDDVMTFATTTTPPGATLMDYRTSLRYAPSDSSVAYLSAYRYTAQNVKVLLLYKSTDHGATFSAATGSGLPTPTNGSLITIAGIDPSNSNTIYVDVSYVGNVAGDTIYKSTNGGGSFTQIKSLGDSIAFLARANGDLVIGTKSLGAEVSHNGGTSWTPLTNPPHINCLAENSAGEVWACTQNYETMTGSGSATIAGDGFGIMKSTDLATWIGVLKYQDIQAPVTCPAGTPQHDNCVGSGNWCGVRTQLGITATGGVDCSASPGVDGPPDAGTTHVTPPGSKGCCDTGTGSAPPLLMGLIVGISLLRRRRTV